VDEIGRILPGLFRKQIRRTEPHLVEILLPLWPRIAGKTLAHHSRPALFASGLLTVATDCPTWSGQLRHMTEELRAGINGFLGQPIVRKLRIKTEPASLFSGLLSTKAARQCAALSPNFREQVTDTAAIADREIAAAFAASYAKYFSRHRT
jgi:hypothetical protein